MKTVVAITPVLSTDSYLVLKYSFTITKIQTFFNGNTLQSRPQSKYQNDNDNDSALQHNNKYNNDNDHNLEVNAYYIEGLPATCAGSQEVN